MAKEDTLNKGQQLASELSQLIDRVARQFVLDNIQRFRGLSTEDFHDFAGFMESENSWTTYADDSTCDILERALEEEAV